MAFESDLIRVALSRSLMTRGLVSLYSNETEPDRFVVGWLAGLSDTAYIVATVDEVGRADEYQVGLIENLFLVVTGGEYLEAISRLMMDHFGQWKDVSCTPDIDGVFEWANENREVISLLHRNDLTYQGRINELDDSCIAFDAYSPIGKSEGIHILRRQDILRIAFSGPDQRALGRLLES